VPEYLSAPIPKDSQDVNTWTVVRSIIPYVVLVVGVQLALEVVDASIAVRSAVGSVAGAALPVFAGYRTRRCCGPRYQARDVAFRTVILLGVFNLAVDLLVAATGGQPRALEGWRGMPALPSFWSMDGSNRAIVVVGLGIVLSVLLLITWIWAWLMSAFGYWIAGD
jgi:hypothetical protein